MVVPIPFAVVTVSCVAAAVTDIWKFKVSNSLTFPLLISGLLYHSLCDDSLALGLWGSLQGALFGFGILVGFFLLGGMGAGDVKLMAGLGAWLGVGPTFLVFVASGLVTGVYALALMVAGTQGQGKRWWRFGACKSPATGDTPLDEEIHKPDRRQRLIPFAAMMAIGLLLVVLVAWLRREQ